MNIFDIAKQEKEKGEAKETAQRNRALELVRKAVNPKYRSSILIMDNKIVCAVSGYNITFNGRTYSHDKWYVFPESRQWRFAGTLTDCILRIKERIDNE